MITLLPIFSLLIFGGATLKDFAFALMVGIISGAYSSIFIAAPLLTIWKEREPEYARRIGQEPPSGDAAAAAIEASEEALAAEPAPDLSPVGAAERAGGSQRGEARAPAAAATREAPWPLPLSFASSRKRSCSPVSARWR